MEAKAKRATAITGDGKRGEKMIVASTQRVQAYIYLCVASRCWAFVVPDDGRLSRETTSEAFASSSSSRLLFLFTLSFSASLFLVVGLRLFIAYRINFSRTDFSINEFSRRKDRLNLEQKRCTKFCAIGRFF